MDQFKLILFVISGYFQSQFDRNANMLLADNSKLVGTMSFPLMGHEDTSLIVQYYLELSQNAQPTYTFSLAWFF